MRILSHCRFACLLFTLVACDAYAQSLIRSYVPPDAEQAFSRASKLLDRGDCAKALSALQRALEIAPAYSSAHNEVGNCHIKLGNIEAAERSFRSALENAVTVYPALNLADLLAKSGRTEEARSVITDAARQHPERGDAYYSLAVIEFQQGRYTEAEALARKAHQFIHRIADVHMLLAKIATARKDWTTMLAEVDIYLREAPDSAARKSIRTSMERFRKSLRTKRE